MDKHVQKDMQKDLVELSKLFAQHFPGISSSNLALAQPKEQEEHSMRWIFLCVIAGWIAIGLIGSIALFILTRSNLAFVPLTAIVGFVSPFFGIIVRFFFWRSEDYKQEELKQILKVRKLELRCQIGKA